MQGVFRILGIPGEMRKASPSPRNARPDPACSFGVGPSRCSILEEVDHGGDLRRGREALCIPSIGVAPVVRDRTCQDPVHASE